MPKVSIAIMAHPSRGHHVKELMEELPSAEVVWDEINDRWDTGRRAMLAFSAAADWHVVVQDDALLCRRFREGVESALASVPADQPVSFYTGKTQPCAPEVKQAVARALEAGKSWFSMRGPLWGVAIAMPTHMIEPMIEAVDDLPIPNYDMRMAEYFIKQDIDCYYSIPSLVNHRVGPENPSLVEDRGSSDKRTAYAWIDKRDPTIIDWDTGVLPWMNLEKRRWRHSMHGYLCGACGDQFEWLADVISHHFSEHELGPVDFLATTPESATLMRAVLARMPSESRGNLWQIGDGGIRPSKIKRILSRNPARFTVVDSYKAMKYVTGRNAWSMDNYSAMAEDDQEMANVAA